MRPYVGLCGHARHAGSVGCCAQLLARSGQQRLRRRQGTARPAAARHAFRLCQLDCVVASCQERGGFWRYAPRHVGGRGPKRVMRELASAAAADDDDISPRRHCRLWGARATASSVNQGTVERFTLPQSRLARRHRQLLPTPRTIKIDDLARGLSWLAADVVISGRHDVGLKPATARRVKFADDGCRGARYGDGSLGPKIELLWRYLSRYRHQASSCRLYQLARHTAPLCSM